MGHWRVLPCLYHLWELFNVVHFFGVCGLDELFGYKLWCLFVKVNTLKDHDNLNERRFKGSYSILMPIVIIKIIGWKINT
jgi:hypothetical protein